MFKAENINKFRTRVLPSYYKWYPKDQELQGPWRFNTQGWGAWGVQQVEFLPLAEVMNSGFWD